jgi:hypothetical protein
MSDSLFDEILDLSEDLSGDERAQLIAYLQALDSGRVFLCKSERDIFLQELGSRLDEK